MAAWRMAAWRGFIAVCVVAAAGCAHWVRENPMIARSARDLTCDRGSVRWQALSEQAYVAHGCDRQAKYVVRCHEEFENPARPTYPPIDVCEWALEGVRPEVPPPPPTPPPTPTPGPVSNPPR
jgi:hypothetical protein